MSLYLDFEPHSWYKDFAVRRRYSGKPFVSIDEPKYIAYTDNGNTYRVDEIKADTLKELKEKITIYRENEKAKSERLYKGVNDVKNLG